MNSPECNKQYNIETLVFLYLPKLFQQPKVKDKTKDQRKIKKKPYLLQLSPQRNQFLFHSRFTLRICPPSTAIIEALPILLPVLPEYQKLSPFPRLGLLIQKDINHFITKLSDRVALSNFNLYLFSFHLSSG